MGKIIILLMSFVTCSFVSASQPDFSYKIKTGYLISIHEKDTVYEEYKSTCGDFLFSVKKLESGQCIDLRSIYENCEAFCDNRGMADHLLKEDSSKLQKLTEDFFDSITAAKPIARFENKEVTEIPVTIIYRDLRISSDSGTYFKTNRTSRSCSCFKDLSFTYNAVKVLQTEYMFLPY